MTGRILPKLALAVGAPFAAFGVADFAVQAADVIPMRQSPIAFWGVPHDTVFDQPEGAFRPSLEWFWEPRPGGTFVGETINADGYRGRIFSKAKTAKLRIATLGDSSTMGFEVKEAEAWPRRLEARLVAAGHDAEVVNFGVVGFTVFQARALYRGRVRDYSPDVVVLACGAINEHFAAEQTIDDAERARIFSSPGYRARELLSRYTLYRWLERRLGRHTSATYAAARTASPAGEPVVRVTPAELEQCVEDLDREQRERGGRLVVVCPPRMRVVERENPRTPRYTDAIHRVTERLRIPHVPVYETFRKLEEPAADGTALPRRNDQFLDVVHPSVRGHDLYAELVLDELKRAGAL